jgi:hypothetical protein
MAWYRQNDDGIAMTPGHAGQLTTVWIIVLVAEFAMLKGWVSHKMGDILTWGDDND